MPENNNSTMYRVIVRNGDAEDYKDVTEEQLRKNMDWLNTNHQGRYNIIRLDKADIESVDPDGTYNLSVGNGLGGYDSKVVSGKDIITNSEWLGKRAGNYTIQRMRQYDDVDYAINEDLYKAEAEKASANITAFNDEYAEKFDAVRGQAADSSRKAQGLSFWQRMFTPADKVAPISPEEAGAQAEIAGLNAERERLQNEYNSNRYVQMSRGSEARAAKALADEYGKMYLELQDKFLVDNPMAVMANDPAYGYRLEDPEARRFNMASQLESQTARLYSSAAKPKGYWANYGRGAADEAVNPDNYFFGWSEIDRNFTIRNIYDNAKERGLDLETATEEEIDAKLTPGEKALLSAFVRNSVANSELANSLPDGYAAGQNFVKSLPYMADFILSTGLGNAVGTVAKASDRGLVRWLGRALKGEEGKAFKESVRRAVVSEAVNAGGAIDRALVKKAVRQGVATGRVYDIAVQPMVSGLWHTATQASTLRTLSENLLSLDDNQDFISYSDAFWGTLADQFIENASESIGGPLEDAVSDAVGLGNKALKKSTLGKTTFGQWARWLNDSYGAQVLRQAGFNGLVGEMAEEWIGNAARVGLYGASGGKYGMNGEEFKDFISIKSQLDMAASFAPMTLFGFGSSSVAASVQAGRFKDAADKFRGVLGRLDPEVWTEDKIKSVMDSKLTKEELVDALAPAMNEIVRKANKGEMSLEDYKATIEFAQASAANSVLQTALSIERNRERDGVRTEIETTLGGVTPGDERGRFWQNRKVDGADGEQYTTETVVSVTDSNGEEYYNVGDNGSQVLLRAKDGSGSVFMDKGEYNAAIESGRMTVEEELIHQYLGRQVDIRREAEERARKEEARQGHYDTLLKMVGRTLPFGEKNGTVVRVDRDGVVVDFGSPVLMDGAESRVHKLSYEAVGNAIGQDFGFKTEQDKAAEAADEIRRGEETLRVMNRTYRGVDFTADGHSYRFGKMYKLPYTDETGESVADVIAVDAATGEDMQLTIPVRTLDDAVSSQREIAARLEEQKINEQSGANGVPRDIRGNEIPLKQRMSGNVPVTDEQGNPVMEVDKNAFLAKDKEAFFAWNDQQRGGDMRDSKQQIDARIGALTREYESISAALVSETDLDRRDELEARSIATADEMASYKALQKKYDALMNYPAIMAEYKEKMLDVCRRLTFAKTDAQRGELRDGLAQIVFEMFAKTSDSRANLDMATLAQEYQTVVDGYRDHDAVVTTYADVLNVLAADGVDPDFSRTVAGEVAYTVAHNMLFDENLAINGFNINNKIYILADGNIDKARVETTYLHERQHAINRTDNSLVEAIKSIYGGNRDVMVRQIRLLIGSKSVSAYADKGVDELADELSAFCMERANGSADYEEKLRALGIDERVITEIIKEYGKQHDAQGRLIRPDRQNPPLNGNRRADAGDNGAAPQGEPGNERDGGIRDGEHREDEGGSGNGGEVGELPDDAAPDEGASQVLQPSKPLPMRRKRLKDGTVVTVVDSDKLAAEDPAAWAEWNEAQGENKIVDTKRFLENLLRANAAHVDKQNKKIEKLRNGTSQSAIEDALEEWRSLVDYGDKVKAALAGLNAQKEGGQTIAAEKREEAARQANEAAAEGFPAIQQRFQSAKKSEGVRDEIKLANGENITGRYILVEADAITASHNPLNGFRMSDGFPVDENGRTVNDRDYERDKDAQKSVLIKADDYDQRAFNPAPPIVSSDGIVLSGNDRTMAGQLAAKSGTDEKYISYLKNFGEKFGFSEEEIGGFSHPRVVFVPDAAMDYTTQNFAKFNADYTKSQNKVEKAVKAGKTISQEALAQIATEIGAYDDINAVYGSAEAVNNLLKILITDGFISREQIESMRDGDRLSGTGSDIVEAALVGAVLEEDALRVVMNDPTMRKAVVSAIGQVIQNGTLGADFNLKNEIADAIAMVGKAKSEGAKVGESLQNFIREQDLFGDNAIAEATVQLLADVINSRQTSSLKKALSLYNNRAVDAAAGIGDMFGDEQVPETKEKILKDVINYFGYGTRTFNPAESGQEPAGAGPASETSDAAGGNQAGGERESGEPGEVSSSKISNTQGGAVSDIEAAGSSVDNQGNPVDANGKLILEPAKSIDELTDEDLNTIKEQAKRDGQPRLRVFDESFNDSGRVNFRFDITPEVRDEMESIKAVSRVDGTYMKAPNGQPTKLNEEQWALVRTSGFKNWFGDWEKTERANAIKEIKPISINGAKSISQKEAESIVSTLENGENKFDGRKTTWVKSSIGKILRHKGFDSSLLIPKLKDIYDNSIHILSEEEKPKEGHKEHSNFNAYHHYVGKVELDSKEYYVRFTLQEINTKRKNFIPNQLHSTFVSDIEIYSTESGVNTGNTPATATNGAKIVDTKLENFFREANNSSKVVDENGEPMVVYHFTDKDFTVFDKGKIGSGNDGGFYGTGFYFSPDREYASSYGSNAMAVFLDIRNPFIANSEESSLASILFNRGADTDAYLPLVPEDIRAKYADSISSADGVIHNAPSALRGGQNAFEIVVPDPNQIKSATENNGEFSRRNNDIRFRIQSEIGNRAEEGQSILGLDGNKTLLGLHNISAEKLRKAIKMGGLANPSTAVINTAVQDFLGYGEISLLMPPSLVDKKTGRNAGTFERDAWTPIYPKVEYFTTKESDARRAKLLEPVKDERLRATISNHIYHYVEGNLYNSGLEYLFLIEKGIEPTIVFKENKYGMTYDEFKNKYLGGKEFDYDSLTEEQKTELAWLAMYGTEEKIAKYKKLAEENNEIGDVIRQHLEDYKNFSRLDSLNYSIAKASRESGELDTDRTLESARQAIEANGLEEEFKEWEKNAIEGIGFDERIFLGYRPDGSGIYRKNTLENVSKYMKSQGRNASKDHWANSEGKIMAMTARKFDSLAQIIKNSGRLQSRKNEIMDPDAKSLGLRLNEAAWLFTPGIENSKDWFMDEQQGLGYIEDFIVKGRSLDSLVDEYNSRSRGEKISLTDEQKAEIEQLRRDIINAPSSYFETKFERPVMLGEFGAAVVPEGESREIVEHLEASGLPVYTYDSKAEGSRQQAVTRAARENKLLFRISENGAIRQSDTLTPEQINALRMIGVPVESTVNRADVDNGESWPTEDREQSYVRFSKITPEQDQEYLAAVEAGDMAKASDMLVRSEGFKEWFGDWEKTERIERLKKSKSIPVSANEYNGKYELNADSAQKWILDNLRGSYNIDDTGEKVVISRVGAEEVTSHSRTDMAHLKSISVIPEMLKNAIFIEEQANAKSNGKFDSYRYYVVGLNIDGEDYTAKIVIGVKQGKKYYDHRLTEMEKTKLIDVLNQPASDFTTAGNASLPPYINGKDRKLFEILTNNSSKIVDKDGKPLVVYHGTANDFNKFNSSRRGIWLTPSKERALNYAKAKDGDRVISLFADVRNLAESEYPNADKDDWRPYYELGYDGWASRNDDGSFFTIVVKDPSQIKSAEPVTKNGKGNVIPLSERFNSARKDIRFSKTNETERIFISNAGAAVEKIKMEKATPEQWKAMIAKEGGMKAAEDKWLGLSQWLDESKAKTLTKDDVMNFINENAVQIEEVAYGDLMTGLAVINREFTDKKARLRELFDMTKEDVDNLPAERLSDITLYDEMHDDAESEDADFIIAMAAFKELEEDYHGGDDFVLAFEVNNENDGLDISDEDRAGYFIGINPINSVRSEYTSEGLENKREIALTVPTVEPWNENDDVHFGDAGEGRAIAWIRFGDTRAKRKETPERKAHIALEAELESKYGRTFMSPESSITDEEREAFSESWLKANKSESFFGEKVLFIDEIQSKRHQEGREKGYKDLDAHVKALNAFQSFNREMHEKYGQNTIPADWSEADRNRFNELRDAEDTTAKNISKGIPAAPFEKNWHELAFKRMLRLAAEEGYDKVAWTTGDTQAERYSLSTVFDAIRRNDNSFTFFNSNGQHLVKTDDEGVITWSSLQTDEVVGKPLSALVGKEIAVKMMGMEDNAVLEGEDIRVGGEGMKGFYDDILPRFVNKYGKKWGVKVYDQELPAIGQTAHVIDVTPEMKESVKRGQVMFSKVARVSDEAESLLAQMQKDAESIEPRELTKEIWESELHGKPISTPIGDVKFGENQYEKYKGKGRTKEFGMVLPTLQRPDVIFEKYEPEGDAERDTKYIFVKTFIDEAGNKNVNYASVSVQKEGLEVIISSHRLRDRQVLNYITNEPILWNRFASDSKPLAQGGSMVQSEVRSASKGSENSETSKPSGKKPLFSKVGLSTEETMTEGNLSEITPESLGGKSKSLQGLQNFDRDKVADALMQTYSQLPDDARRSVGDDFLDNGLRLGKAVADHFARLAGKESLSEDELAQIRMLRRNMQEALGVNDLSVGDVLWSMYQTANPDGDLLSVARKSIMADNLGYSVQQRVKRGVAQGGVRMSITERMESESAAQMYNASVAYYRNRLKEAVVDMYESVNDLVAAIEKSTGKKAMPFEDVRLALNQMSSKGLAAMKNFTARYLEPLWKQIAHIVRDGGVKYDDLVRYVMLKHALERNVVFAKRDAKAQYRDEYNRDVAVVRQEISELQKEVKSLERENERLLQKRRDALMDGDATLANGFALQMDDVDNRINAANKKIAGRGERLRKLEEKLNANLEAVDNGTAERYKELRENDYAGLTAMYGEYPGLKGRDFYVTEEEYNKAARAVRTPKYDSLAEMEAAATKEVAVFEGFVVSETGESDSINSLWDAINGATKETLKFQYEHGVVSRQEYERARDMFSFYVPLRGFKDVTASDLWEYFDVPRPGSFAPTLLTAKGRKTEADNPFNWIGTMASSAIAQGVKNEAKSALYYFVANRPDGQDIAKISGRWYVYDEAATAVQRAADPTNNIRVFKESVPPLLDRMTPEEARRAVEVWEETMIEKAKRGEAYSADGKLDVGKDVVFISDNESLQHIVKLKVNGKEKQIIINGSPRAAQAVNGNLNLEIDSDFRKFTAGVLRWMSAVNTSYNPEFWISNMQRDLLFAIMGNSVKGYGQKGFVYLDPGTMMKLATAYENGTTGELTGRAKRYAAMYEEFAANGGITGFTSVEDNDKWESEIAQYIEPGLFRRIKESAPVAAFVRLGEAVENATRFAAYMQARNSGKSVAEAVDAAKEVSVNFNRKGSGQKISWRDTAALLDKEGRKIGAGRRAYVFTVCTLANFGRKYIMFFNAAVQGLNQMAKFFGKDKRKMAAWLGGYFALGVINAAIHAAMDDDDDYLDIPENTRQQNMLVGAKGFYIKWALPQEARAFYALGDLLANKALGKMPEKGGWETSTDIVNMFMDMAPLGGNEGVAGLLPSVVKPAYDLAINRDFAGRKIYNDMPFLSEAEKEVTPKYGEALKGTWNGAVLASRLMNALSGGDEIEAGAVNVSPEKIQYVIESVGGGAIRTVNKFSDFVAGGLDAVTGKDITGTELTARRVPFLNRVLEITDDYNGERHINELFYHYRDIAEQTELLLKRAEKADSWEKEDEIYESTEYEIFDIYNTYRKLFKSYDDDIKSEEDKEIRKSLIQERNELRKEFIDEISQLSR